MENIQVAVRLRPLSGQELMQGEDSIWGVHLPHHVYLQPHMQKEMLANKRVNGTRTTFTFDSCFGPTDKNDHIYSSSVRNIVLGSLKGINGTVFVYGQTGSGKTYTMLGPHSNRHDLNSVGPDQGVLFQSLRELFENIENDLDKTYVLRCSYIEIYNEQIFDLLKPPSRLAEVLTINEDTKKEFFVKGVTEESVSNVEEILDVLQRGELNRHYAQTSMNHHSSRSHAIFRLTVQSITNNFIRNYRREQSQLKFPTQQQLEQQEEQPTEVSQEHQDLLQGAIVQGALITESILNFVDLAGSEKVSNHTNQIDESFAQPSVSESRYDDPYSSTATHRAKDRVKEGQYINKSLFFLTQVIFLKAEDKGHIPYRNSSLTKILRSSLGGNSRTLIILCINPTHSQFEYSLSTIRFGMNAKKIENKVRANIRNHNDDEAIKIIISEYEKRIRDLEKSKGEDKETLEFLKDQLTQKSQMCEQLQKRLEILNRQNFMQKDGSDSLTPQPTKKLRRLVQSVNEVKQKQCLHVEAAGDLIVPQRGPTRIKVLIKDQPIHDCNGKLALRAFKAQKQRSNQLQQQIGVLIENFQKVKDDYLNQFQQLGQMKNQITRMTEDQESQALDYKELYKKAEEMAKLLDLTYIPKWNETQLTEVRTFYQEQLSELQKEDWRRQMLKQLQIKPPTNNDSAKKMMDQFKLTQSKLTSSQDSLVLFKENLNEEKILNVMYGSLEKQEKHLQHIKEIGQNLFRRVHPQSYRLQSPRNQNARFEKSNELDSWFFNNYKESSINDIITYEELLEEMEKFEPEKESQKESYSSSSESSRPPLPSRKSSHSFAASNTSQPLNDDDSEIITIFDKLQAQEQSKIEGGEAEDDQDKLKRTFTQALMEFIAEVDKDKVNRFIKESNLTSHNATQINIPSNNQTSIISSPTPITESLQRHKTENYAQSTTSLVKRSFQTPDQRNQRSKNNRTPTQVTTKNKPNTSQKPHTAERNNTKSQARMTINQRRQIITDVPKRQTAPKVTKSTPKLKNENILSTTLIQQKEDYSVMRVQQIQQWKHSQMQDITNSPQKGKSMILLAAHSNSSQEEYF